MLRRDLRQRQPRTQGPPERGLPLGFGILALARSRAYNRIRSWNRYLSLPVSSVPVRFSR